MLLNHTLRPARLNGSIDGSGARGAHTAAKAGRT